MKILDILLESVNPDIKQAQDILVSKGLLSANAVDGTLNDATKAALDKLFGGTTPPATTSSGAPVKGSKNPVDPNAIKSYLSSKGLDANHVAGIMANIKAESNFDSGVLGDSGQSGGLVQHHGPRFTNMIQAAGGPDKWQSNWKAQLDFALSEPAGKQYATTQFATPEDATSWWTIHFEIPANKEQQAAIRSKSAAQYA